MEEERRLTLYCNLHGPPVIQLRLRLQRDDVRMPRSRYVSLISRSIRRRCLAQCRIRFRSLQKQTMMLRSRSCPPRRRQPRVCLAAPRSHHAYQVYRSHIDGVDRNATGRRITAVLTSFHACMHAPGRTDSKFFVQLVYYVHCRTCILERVNKQVVCLLL
ncbi:hypothetical protein BDV95DRAFT_170683 [Massariosphaeria phaeospora]|uniref:Uncharacterized protein n=1 Tax=Massariosphaeria phaeospora TaxID=100035 RepID=A0A7C8I0P9_9PLEO|nr:hypothetical protein BDV95DRAFT_170683 [Massariosphaeria phaeospora]